MADGISPQPEPTTGIAPTGRGNTQNRHSNSQSQAAATEIFNSPLNSTETANCQNLAIAPNISQILRFAPVFSRSLAFFIRRVSFFRYSLSRSKYIYNLSVSIRCLLDAYNTHSLTLLFSPPIVPLSFPLSPSLAAAAAAPPPLIKRKAPGVLSLDALALVTAYPVWPQ